MKKNILILYGEHLRLPTSILKNLHAAAQDNNFIFAGDSAKYWYDALNIQVPIIAKKQVNGIVFNYFYNQ